MKSPSLRRISALVALAVLFTGTSHAESAAGFAPTGKVCASIYVDCVPGARFSAQTCSCVPESDPGNICPALDCGRGQSMNRMTCRCTPDGDGDFHTYEKFGADLRDAVGSGNQGSAGAMLSARFDGLASAGDTGAPVVAAYAAAPSVAGYTGGYSTRLSRHVEPGDVPSPDEVKKPLPPPAPGKPKLRRAIFTGERPRIVLATDNDANPKNSDNAIVGATAGAIAGSAGGALGAAAGMAAGALAGAHQDQQEKARKDEKSYDDGKRAWEKDHGR